jgi:SAM-dependent methyltransferase
VSFYAISPDPDKLNAQHWAYVCGSHRAQEHGEFFDEWFFNHYPWIEYWVPFDYLSGKRVLEVGIGSGTVARRLARISDFYALDVAQAPLDGIAPCLEFPDRAVCGSVLDAPFEDGCFDWVVSLGCVHHTGDVQQALNEICRITKPGGGGSFMVYHKDSGKPEKAELWDPSPNGGPPFTEWFTVPEFEQMLNDAGYAHVNAGVENMRAPNGINVYARAFR